MNQRKYIITGPAGSGKSTLISKLEAAGISCIKEVSRQVIINEQISGKDGMPWADIERFTTLVYQQSLRCLKQQSTALFCDRSLVDNIAYLHHAQKPIPKYLQQFPFLKYYHRTVFFAPSWENIYTTDPQRPEPYIYHHAITTTLKNTYQALGFKLIELPKMDTSIRVNLVLSETLGVFS